MLSHLASFPMVNSIIFAAFVTCLCWIAFITNHLNLRPKIQTAVIVLCVVVGVLGTLFSVSQFFDFPRQIPNANDVAQLISSGPHSLVWGLVIAVLLYRFRGIRPVLYGILEILAGLLSMFVAITNINGDSLATFVTFVGGMYVIIRGLDNIDRGLQSRYFREYWGILFPKR